MLKFVRVNKYLEILRRLGMRSKYERDYVTRHVRIRNKLMELAKKRDCGCFSIPKVATELGMDQRTVRAHLKIIEINNGGVFLDPQEKEFCTKAGLLQLARRLGLKEIIADQES
jgi:predicted transcriptional regulator